METDKYNQYFVNKELWKCLLKHTNVISELFQMLDFLFNLSFACNGIPDTFGFFRH
jgi:hypothetical protein